MDTSLVHTSLWEIVRLPLVEICIVGALAGLVGVFAVLKRRVFFAESVTHGTFPGAVLGVVVGSSLCCRCGCSPGHSHYAFPSLV